MAFYLSKKNIYCVGQPINISIHILLPTLLLTSIRKIFQNLALTSLYILKIVDEIIHSILRFRATWSAYYESDTSLFVLISVTEQYIWNVMFILTLPLQEIVERILLAIISQAGFELWRNLTPKTVLQELHHAPVKMFLHTS